MLSIKKKKKKNYQVETFLKPGDSAEGEQGAHVPVSRVSSI